ncbi:MAG TPA: NAD(P)/FAD-dependent oxidoreductase [Kofleriaceae bacterium]|nr:NAD(P)/FAD-dependent oxidoreductase [Kofleriaceae bacterium]
MKNARIGVVGCGTAGAAAAILFARAGNHVTVLERVAAPGPVGAGIMIQPTGQAVLGRLGLLDAIAAKGARIDRLWFRTHTGRTLVDLHYAKVDQAWFGIGLHRGVLFEALYNAARHEPRVTVHTGCAVTGLRRDGDQTWLVAPDTEHGPFDLVIVADGSVSELRNHAGETKRDAAYPWGALWFVADDREGVFQRELYQVGVRARRLYGVLPTGHAPRGQGPVVSLFWSLAASELDTWRAGGLAAWKAEVAAIDPRVQFVLDQIDSVEQITFARYRDVQMTRWHDRRVVFIGDAAHATSPQLGQGANLALVDALVLADALAAAPSLDAGLDQYVQNRRGHLRYYQRMTRWLTPLFQSSSQLLGWFRDWTFPIANRVPPLRNLMIKTMAGVSMGFVARPLKLPLSLKP